MGSELKTSQSPINMVHIGAHWLLYGNSSWSTVRRTEAKPHAFKSSLKGRDF